MNRRPGSTVLRDSGCTLESSARTPQALPAIQREAPTLSVHGLCPTFASLLVAESVDVVYVCPRRRRPLALDAPQSALPALRFGGSDDGRAGYNDRWRRREPGKAGDDESDHQLRFGA
jgi:hypothetical protein